MNDTEQRIRSAIIHNEGPVVTVAELAEELDVSRQTVLNHVESLTEFRDIRRDTIGQATVFWHDPDRDFAKNFLRLTPAQRREEMREVAIVGKRAAWLDAKDRAQKWRREDGEDPSFRVFLWEKLRSYVGTDAYRPVAFTNEEIVEVGGEETEMREWEHRVNLPEQARVDEEDVREYDESVYLFESDWFGEVRGFHGFARFEYEMKARFQEHNDGEYEELNVNDLPTDVVDQTMPSVSDIIMTGDAYDQLFCDIFALDW